MPPKANPDSVRNKPEYRNWIKMKTRCSNTKDKCYPRYGGRGISVCERWLHSFQNFLDDLGAKPSNAHSLDRIDVNGNYEPGNVRWATPKEQGRNRRNNKLITAFGETKCLSEWAEDSRCVVNLPTLETRIRRAGWSPERALTQHNIEPKYKNGKFQAMCAAVAGCLLLLAGCQTPREFRAEAKIAGQTLNVQVMR